MLKYCCDVATMKGGDFMRKDMDCAKMERIRDWDIFGLVHNINLDELKQNLAETSTSELIAVYKALSNVIDLCLHFANIPAVTFPLSELSFAYSLELTNRMILNGENISNADIKEYVKNME